MQTAAIINIGAQSANTIAPAKAENKEEPQFGQVLNQKQLTQQPQDKNPAKNQSEAETTTEPNGSVLSGANPEQQSEEQHSLIELLKTIVPAEMVEKTESSDEIKILLTNLLQQLEATKEPEEQPLDKVELSALVTKLKSQHQASDHGELLTQVKQQLTDNPGLLANGELVAAIKAELQQKQTAAVATGKLTTTQQMLQQPLNGAIAANSTLTEENLAIAKPQNGGAILAAEEVVEKVDPRFVELLKPRAEERSLQPALKTKDSSQPYNYRQPGLNQTEPAAPLLTDEIVEPKLAGEIAPKADGSAKQMLENISQAGQRNLQPPVNGLELNRTMAPSPVVQLASGQQVTESQIFDQVSMQLSGSINGKIGRMVLRLQPAELGSLRIELIVEGEQIRANLQAQSQQVQEILERNLPQLRNALAEQGLKIDQLQVSVDKNTEQQSQFENLAQKQQSDNPEKSSDWQHDAEPEEQLIPLAHLLQNGGGGISLHV